MNTLESGSAVSWIMIALIVLVVILMAKRHMSHEGFETNQSFHATPQADPSAYYQQHSRYPTGAWWIDYAEPSHKCQLKARVNCHNQYCYDSCYENQLKHCQAPTPKGMLPYQVKSLPPPQCPQSPPYPNYL